MEQWCTLRCPKRTKLVCVMRRRYNGLWVSTLK